MSYVSYVHIGNGEEVSIKDEGAVRSADLFDLIYPVGSIYMSVNNTDPGTLFAGTEWDEWGVGRVPVGVDLSQAAFNSVEKEGGNVDAIVPQHHHSYTKPPTSTDGHTLTAAQSGNQAQTVTTSYMSGNNYISGQVTVRKTGEATDTIWSPSGAFSVGVAPAAKLLTGAGNVNANAHLLYFGATVEHTHSVSVAAKNATTAHSHSITNTTANTSDTGVSATNGNLQPYITCYMWKRVS